MYSSKLYIFMTNPYTIYNTSAFLPGPALVLQARNTAHAARRPGYEARCTTIDIIIIIALQQSACCDGGESGTQKRLKVS